MTTLAVILIVIPVVISLVLVLIASLAPSDGEASEKGFPASRGKHE